jgi:ATPase complex subunit ATP10
LGITNRYLGYVFLVDSEGKVRWGAHGNATPKELETMVKLTGELKAELRKKKDLK